jgi:hypothetical protein
VCEWSLACAFAWRSRFPFVLKLRISARYLYDLGQLVRVESCMCDLVFDIWRITFDQVALFIPHGSLV